MGSKALKWAVWSILIVAWISIARPRYTSAQKLPKHSRDSYYVGKALLFFNAQKSGKLPKDNGISWRGDSGLRDGMQLTDLKRGLVGGYYDSGENTKFHFPMAFAMTMLSWSVIEYPHKYRAIDEYNHVRELIKWGTDYLLFTFDSKSPKINKIYSQVGGATKNSKSPNDFICWERPEDMDYPRPIQTTFAGPDLAGEMAAALASASIVFKDKPAYSKKLIEGAQALFAFARDPKRRRPYSRGNPWIEPYYNSTGYFDEYLWGATWLYFATGKLSYLKLATNPGLARNAMALRWTREKGVLSWDNKVPSALMLLTRVRMFLNPIYPYEDTLMQYHNVTNLFMCSYLKPFGLFKWSKGGLIQLKDGESQPLQYVANAVFLANLFADYLNATGIPGFYCGPNFVTVITLQNFASSQINYILGKNPKELSDLVGSDYLKYPNHVHHRAASIPTDGIKYSCGGGYKWRDNSKPNPNTIVGAMVGGPDRLDRFHDDRRHRGSNEPTLAGNAGLVAALISLTTSGGNGVDRNSIFANVPPFFP